MRLAVLTRRGPDGSYLAVCPSLPSCVSKGRTVEEALRKHQDAIRIHVASVTDFVPGRVRFNVVHA